jgi:hypothetical protein
MRTFSIPPFRAIAVVAKDLQPWWKPLLLEPGVEAVTAGTLSWLARSSTVDVIERQKALF